MGNLTESLIITGIGMGLVFLTIVVLWALMALLAAWSGRSRKGAEEKAVPPEDLAAQAAALAVAIALSEQEQSSIRPFPLPQTQLVSAWQLGRRSENLNKQGKVR